MRQGRALLGAGCLALASGCAEEQAPIETAVIYVAATTNATTALAGFYDELFGSNRCKSESFDRCIVSTCFDGGARRTYVDGGEIDIQGNELDVRLDTGRVEDENGNVGPGLAVAEGLPALSDNEQLTMTVRGRGSVSRAEGSVTMPVRLELTEPEVDELSCQGVDPETLPAVSISADDDFTIRWTSERADDVDILFFFDDVAGYTGDEDRERATAIRCLHTADEERATIPEEVVERMPTGVRGSFTMRQIVRNAKLVGDWSITFGGYWELCAPVEVE